MEKNLKEIVKEAKKKEGRKKHQDFVNNSKNIHPPDESLPNELYSKLHPSYIKPYKGLDNDLKKESSQKWKAENRYYFYQIVNERIRLAEDIQQVNDNYIKCVDEVKEVLREMEKKTSLRTKLEWLNENGKVSLLLYYVAHSISLIKINEAIKLINKKDSEETTFNEIKKIKQINQALGRASCFEKREGQDHDWFSHFGSYNIENIGKTFLFQNENHSNTPYTILVNNNHYHWLATEEAMNSLPKKSSLATFT